MPASGKVRRRVGTTAMRRAATTGTRHGAMRVTRRVLPVSTGMTARAAIGPLPIVLPVAMARSVRTPRAARGARRRASPSGNSATRSPMRRVTAVARSGPIRRAAKVFARTATGRRGIAPIVRAHRAMATGPAAIGRTESSTATGNSPAALRIADRARNLATVIASATRGIAAIQSRGRNAMPVRPTMSDAIPARPAMARGVSTSRSSTGRALTNPVTTNRGTTAAARNVRGFRARAAIVRKVTARFANGPNSIDPVTIVRSSIGPAATTTPEEPKAAGIGRNIRAAIAVPIGRAATMRMTAGSSPSARPLAAAAPIANARPRSAVRRVRRVKRNPASASPRWCRGQG